MDTLFQFLLILHISCGVIGLISGSINILAKKGDKRHRNIGRIFTIAMLLAGFSSLILSILHPNTFLFMVGVFTIYMIATGFRYLRHKKTLATSYWLDYMLSIIMLLCCISFILLGLTAIFAGHYFGIVLIVFSSFGIIFVYRDYTNFKGKSKCKNYWLLEHLSRMIGAFIASLTAFLVVNASYIPVQIPSILLWLLPSILLVPYIIVWSRKVEAKKKINSTPTHSNNAS